MKNTFLALLSFILLSTPLAATAEQYADGDFVYWLNGSAVIVTRYFGPGGDVTIPGDIQHPFLGDLPVTGVGDGAFYFKVSLTSVSVPDSVTSIGQDAFADCTNLLSIYVSPNLISIGSGAFFGCNSLTNVTIPASVCSLGSYTFGSCTRLTAITVDPANALYSSLGGVLFNKSQTTLMQYPGGKAGNYAIPDSVTSIGQDAFADCIKLTSVRVPGSIISKRRHGVQPFVPAATDHHSFRDKRHFVVADQRRRVRLHGLHLATHHQPGFSVAVWATNFLAPAVTGSQNVVTNPLTAVQRFFRLTH